MAITIAGSSGIASVDGSAGSPSVKGADSNSGIFYGTDEVKISTGGVERLSITNTGFTGITQGITEVDRWRITSNATGSTLGDPISSNWERVDNTSPSQGMPIGTGMSVSSGIWTFPSTGKWWIRFKADMQVNNTNVRWIEPVIQVTSDNGSNWDNRAFGYASLYDSGNNTYSVAPADTFLDVTDTSNDKVKIKLTAAYSCIMMGSTNDTHTSLTFLRLGDT